LELVAVVVVQSERKVEVVVVQMDHLEDLGNIDVSENLVETPLGVVYHVFLVVSMIKQVR
jgi:xanthine dehydrogenase iron-sulfur cluster and FAD-binding subunit A